MADDYTPTTEQVEQFYAQDAEAEYRDPIHYPALEREARRAFRRWLAAHDAQKRAEWEAEQGETGRFGGIAREVIDEAERSIAKHGEQGHLPMGTGPDTAPLAARRVEPGSMHEPGLWPGMRARQLARIATLDTKAHSANEGGDDTCTWWLILREEVFEAAAEADPVSLREELVQIAAVAVKMIDALPVPDTTREFAPGECDGSGECSAPIHVHGCYTPHRSDQCDSPNEYGHIDSESEGKA